MIKSSLLSDSEHKKLQMAILQYLADQNLSKSFKALQSELNIDLQTDQENIMERRWFSVTRLQKKILEMEIASKAAVKPPVHITETNVATNRLQSITIKGSQLHEFQSHQKPVNCLVFHPTQTLLFSGSEDCSIKIHDSESRVFIKTLMGHTRAVTDLSITEDGNFLISSSSDLSIKVWDLKNDFVCLKTLYGHDDTISGLAVRGNIIISVSRDETIRVWDLNVGYCKNTLTGHTDWIRDVAVAKDVAATCGNDKRILIWNTDSWIVKGELRGHSHVIECIEFAPSAANQKIDASSVYRGPQFLASASRDNTVRMWNILNFECVYVFEGHGNWVKSLTFYADGCKLLSTGDDRTVKGWSLQDGSEQLKIVGHDDFINSIAAHPVIPFFATGSSTIKVWE